MDKEEFASEIKAWLQDSGTLRDMQTKLRKELFEAMLLKKQNQDRAEKETSESDKALNLLILEHLMQRGLWYTASIMTSEAEFLEPPPEIEQVTSTSSSYKRHNPAKFSTQTMTNILSRLKNNDLIAKLPEIESEYTARRNESLLGLCLVQGTANRPVLRKKSVNVAKNRTRQPTSSEVSVSNSVRSQASTQSSRDSESVNASQIPTSSRSVELKRNESRSSSFRQKEVIQGLSKELAESQQEITRLQDSKRIANQLQSVIDGQAKELSELREQIRKVSNTKAMRNVHSSLPSHRNGDSLTSYLAEVKANLEELERQNSKIDRDFAGIDLSQYV